MEKKLPWKMRDLYAVILGITGLFLLTIALFSVIFPKEGPEEGTIITVSTLLIQELIFLVPIYFFIVRRYRVTWLHFGFVNIGWRKTLGYFLKGFGIFVLTTIGIGILSALALAYFQTTIPGFSPQEEHIPLFGTGKFDIVVAFITLVLFAPLIEEFIFRGFLLQTLLHNYRPWIATTLTAAVFSLIHLEFQSAGIIFILALIINRIFMRARSIWPCIVFHMVNNGLAFSVEFFLK